MPCRGRHNNTMIHLPEQWRALAGPPSTQLAPDRTKVSTFHISMCPPSIHVPHSAPRSTVLGASVDPGGAPLNKRWGPPQGHGVVMLKQKNPFKCGPHPSRGRPHMVGGLQKLALGMKVVNSAPPWEGRTGSVAACPGARPHFFVETSSPFVPEGGPTLFFWVAPLSPILLPPIVLETRFVSHGYF